MLRIQSVLLVSLLLLGGCVKDQQAARTRNSGVDKEPEKQENPTPQKPPPERKQPAEELPPVEPPPAQPK